MTLESADRLTMREAEVLAALLDGCTTNAQISSALMISQQTVHFHVNSIMQKFGVMNRTALVLESMRSGVVVGNRWVAAA